MATTPYVLTASAHTLTAHAVLEGLHSTPSGLTSTDAAQRLLEHGPNQLQAAHGVSPWKLLGAQFKNVLVIILLVATVISGFLGHEIEAVAITVIVLLAVVLGFVQEFRAERAIEALRQMAAPLATVLRDGIEVEIAAQDLVPGDVLLLRAGNRVAGDARLLEAINLQAQEAALTGESLAVEKHCDELAAEELALGDRRNMVFAGTVATYGRGRAVVVATGMQTEFGQIAQLLQTVDAGKTPLQQNLDKLAHALARAALVVVAVVVALGVLRGQPWVEMLVFGIALAVAVVPEALPAVVTISLALGVQRLVRRHALMRRLAAVETLGSTSVICSDKTGTLTKDEMTVRRLYAAGELVEVSGAGYVPEGRFTRDGAAVALGEPAREMLRAAVLASDADVVRSASSGAWLVKGDPTEGALVVVAGKAGLHKTDLDELEPRLHEIPFTSETKCMTTLHQTPDGMVAYSKGAPEVILAGCTAQRTAAGESPLSEAGRQAILEVAHAMADASLRVLAMSRRRTATLQNAAHDMTFLGLAGMLDPPRPEAYAALRTCEQAGIRVVMITGDHPATATAVARELGLLKTGAVLTGAELEQMDAAELAGRIDGVAVFARVAPAHKLRVVTALQSGGHVVAMTGDGVNDAPALKKADIGIAMGITGTDVAKEAAAMTLIDDNFASIVAAVEEGRGILDNIKKYLVFLLSCNIGEIGLMAGATLLGLPLPLTAVQILYVNLATDGLPALALAVDPPEPDLMHRKPRNPRHGIIDRPTVVLMLVGGLWSALVNLALFAWVGAARQSTVQAATLTFISLVLIQFFTAYVFRSDHRPVWRRPFANKWLNRAVLWELSLLTLILYLPAFRKAFGTSPLQPMDWVLAAGTAATIVPVLEAGKWMRGRGWFGAAT